DELRQVLETVPDGLAARIGRVARFIDNVEPADVAGPRGVSDLETVVKLAPDFVHLLVGAQERFPSLRSFQLLARFDGTFLDQVEVGEFIELLGFRTYVSRHSLRWH